MFNYINNLSLKDSFLLYSIVIMFVYLIITFIPQRTIDERLIYQLKIKNLEKQIKKLQDNKYNLDIIDFIKSIKNSNFVKIDSISIDNNKIFINCIGNFKKTIKFINFLEQFNIFIESFEIIHNKNKIISKISLVIKNKKIKPKELKYLKLNNIFYVKKENIPQVKAIFNKSILVDNGIILNVGDKYKGFLIKKITKEGVILQKQGIEKEIIIK